MPTPSLGAGQIGNGNGDLTLQNDAAGMVTAQGGTLTIDAAVTNDGTMTAANSATLDLPARSAAPGRRGRRRRHGGGRRARFAGDNL